MLLVAGLEVGALGADGARAAEEVGQAFVAARVAGEGDLADAQGERDVRRPHVPRGEGPHAPAGELFFRAG